MEKWFISWYSIKFLFIAIFDVMFVSTNIEKMEKESTGEKIKGGEIFGRGADRALEKVREIRRREGE